MASGARSHEKADLISARADKRQPLSSPSRGGSGICSVVDRAGNRAVQRLLTDGLIPAKRSGSPAPHLVMRMPEPQLQRQCACGGSVGSGGECAACEESRLPLQAKLTINKPGDAYEQEADRIAADVMSGSALSRLDAAPLRIQRFSGPSNTPTNAAPTSVDGVLSSPGSPLEPALRQEMEQRFGYDFGGVRVHTDASAAESAHAVSARAYTVGGDIVFGRGHYAPGTSEGRKLLAHELTHVLQQSGGDAAAGDRMPVGISTSSANTLQRDSTDDLADEIAHDLDNYVATNPKPYAHIQDVFKNLDSDIEDNVAAAFTYLLDDRSLEAFAEDDDPEGLATLDVLTEAMLTGSVSLFESQQAERILIAKRNSKLFSEEKYVAEAERIAGLRHQAQGYFMLSEDQVVSRIAEDLNAYAAKHLYPHIIEVFDDLPSKIEDNVAAAFVESQSDAKLEEFSATGGNAMLDVLYEAMMTGHVTSFETVQSERILIAKAKPKTSGAVQPISTDEYVAEAEQIAALRDKAEDIDILSGFVVSEGYLAEDAVAATLAHELNVDVAKHLYRDVIRKIRDVGPRLEDNVASHFIELQPPARLEEFAADADGRAMLDVLYDATITGDGTPFERLQADRILKAKAKVQPKSPIPVEKYVSEHQYQRTYIFPVRMQKTFRSSYAVPHASLLSNGNVKVSYDDELHFWSADMFKEDREKNLPPRSQLWGGIELDPDELVFVKLYDQHEQIVPVPALALIDYANQAMHQSVSVGVTAFQTGLFLGFGGLGAFSGARVGAVAAEVEAGEATVTALNLERAALWADRVAMALPLVNIVVEENREWILEKFPNAGPILLAALDQANKIAEYYGWARMGIDGARYLKGQIHPALEQWRAETGAAQDLSSSERKAVGEINRTLDGIQADLGKAEERAASDVVTHVEERDPHVIESGQPGERTAKVDGHELKEERDPVTGAVHCEVHSNEGIPVDCPERWQRDQPKKEPPTEREPLKSEVPEGPRAEATEAARASAKAQRLEDIKQQIAQNDAEMHRLQQKIDKARETVNKATVKATRADEAEYKALGEQVERNRETIERSLDEQRALRWKNNALRDEAGVLSIPETAGGSYNKISAKTRDNFSEANHMPAWDSYNGMIDLSHGEGPSIWMLEEDHKLTASRGSTPQAIEYRAKQRALISQGKFMEAFEMDVQDLVNKGLYKKYEQAILQARAYAKSIDAQKLRPL
jgi:hypothetical protein